MAGAVRVHPRGHPGGVPVRRDGHPGQRVCPHLQGHAAGGHTEQHLPAARGVPGEDHMLTSTPTAHREQRTKDERERASYYN